MSTNNFELIKGLLDFSDPDKFYVLEIIRRKKENPELNKNNKLVKVYYVENMDYLDRKEEEIKSLCNKFNARGMIRLNRRSHKTVAYKTLKKMVDVIEQGNYEFVKNQYNKACGKYHSEKNKMWILDIDKKLSFDELEDLTDLINNLQPIEIKDKIIERVPSQNESHLITTPFNVQTFKTFDEASGIEIHKDNPTNLYIP